MVTILHHVIVNGKLISAASEESLAVLKMMVVFLSIQ